MNEASVTVSGQDAAGIIGGQNDTNPKFVIRNCINTGDITSTNSEPYAGGLCCYLGNSANTIENIINIGTITGHNGGNIGRMMGSVKGIVDLSDTEQKTQGVVEELSSADITSGVLTYYINNVAGKEVFFQTLGEDEYPLPFSTSKSVKQMSLPTCGYATYVAEGNVQIPSMLQAFAVVSTNNNYAQLSAPITEAPVGEPILLKGAEGKYCYNPIASASSPAVNLLQAAVGNVVADGTQYCLADDEDGIGFYKVITGSTISAGKAYLIISGSEAKPFYGLQPDDETGISDLNANINANAIIYNLAGQRLQKTRKGINIVNGEKVIRH